MQVVAGRAQHLELLSRRWACAFGHRDGTLARTGTGRSAMRFILHLSRRARGHDLAAVHAGARAEVDDIVRSQDGFLVVFDHDDGVADIAQVSQRSQQALIVALVQPDRRLVEDVHDANQSGADLAGQPDALCLAARQRVGAAIERQVVEADVGEEAETVARSP